MSKNAKLALEAALERIIAGEPKRVTATRKLSVRAVEEEANLGNGSGYYYPEFVDKVKQVKSERVKDNGVKPYSDVDHLRKKLADQIRIKQKYKEKNDQLRCDISRFAAEQHHLNDALRKALAKVDELEQEKIDLQEKLAKEKRAQIVSIK